MWNNFYWPSGDVIDMMGNKSMARQKMIEAGVPVVPGSDGSVNTYKKLKKLQIKLVIQF